MYAGDFCGPEDQLDGYDAIEWVAAQPWSNGRVGMVGSSHGGIVQTVASLTRPPHLTAMCVWEGAADYYRDMGHHGGIFCNGFARAWPEMQVYTIQNGRGTRGFRSRFEMRFQVLRQLQAEAPDAGDLLGIRLSEPLY